MSFKIDYSTFFQKGLIKYDDDFSINLITGYQGTGKSFLGIYLLEYFFDSKTIYTNIKSYRSLKHNVRYFEKLVEVYDNHDIGAIFLVDELSKKFVKDSKQDLKFYSWLQQCRKHKRHVFLITQEYIQVPQWLRGIATQVYVTKNIFGNVCKTSLGYPLLDKETFEWGIDIKHTFIYKRTQLIGNLYDTFEAIDTL